MQTFYSIKKRSRNFQRFLVQLTNLEIFLSVLVGLHYIKAIQVYMSDTIAELGCLKNLPTLGLLY